MPQPPTTHRTPTPNAAALARVKALAADADPGEDDEDDELIEPIPVWTMPKPGDYAPPDAHGHHAHDGEREIHPSGGRPHYHDPDSSILVFFDPEPTAPLAAWSPTGDGADPTPAGTPGDAMGMAPAASAPGVASRASAGSGAAGSGRPRDNLGRFIAARSLPPRVELRRITPAIVPVSVALEHALIDVDAALWKAAMHLRLEWARTILATIRFQAEADRLEDALAVKAGMLIRLGSDGGGSS